MKLVELCEPLFQYACLLSRSARQGASLSVGQVRDEVHTIFDEMRTRATSGGDAKLRAGYERVELILMVFIDWTITQSPLAIAMEWESLAAERGESDGDEKFFDLLDDALRESTNQSADVLQVFYNCLGLGYAGWYAGQPDYLRKRQREIAAKLRLNPENEREARIVPEAYEHVDSGVYYQLGGASLIGFALALLMLTAVLFGANWYAYHASSRELDRALNHLGGAGDAAAAVTPTH